MLCEALARLSSCITMTLTLPFSVGVMEGTIWGCLALQDGHSILGYGGCQVGMRGRRNRNAQ